MTADVWISDMLALSAALAWAFVALYGFRSPWRSTPVGRSLMYVWVALAVVLSMIVATRYLGDYPGRTVLRVLIYTPLPVAFAQFIRVLLRVQAGRERGEIPARVEGDV